VDCDNHAGRPLIAQGSGTVLINGQPTARVGDRSACDAAIEEGLQNVVIGGPTVTTDAISPEVPGYVHTAMLVVGLASAATLVGLAAAALGFVGGTAGGAVMHQVGGALFGEDRTGRSSWPSAARWRTAGAWAGRACARTPTAPEPFSYSPKKVGQTEPGAVPNSRALQAEMNAATSATARSAPGYPDLPADKAATLGDGVRP